MIAVTIAALTLAAAALAAGVGWALAERTAGRARVEAEKERSARKLAEYERDEALSDVERIQRRADALEEFGRDQIARLGGMLDNNGVDLLLSELDIVSDPRTRPIAASSDVLGAGPDPHPAGRGGDAAPDAGVSTGDPS